MTVEIIDKLHYQGVVTTGFLFMLVISRGIMHLAEKSVQPGRDFDPDSDSDYDYDGDSDE